MAKKNNTTESSRSWFCVLNHPEKIFGEIEPTEMVNKAIEMWIENKPFRTCAVNYEVADTGTPHMHMVLEDPSKSRFSAVQKLFPTIHIQITKGSKAEAEAYIKKEGQFEEKQHTVVVPAVFHGKIKANQGQRSDLDNLGEVIDEGFTPNDIFDMNISNRRFETLVKKHYYRKREKETPRIRDVKVTWHVGDSGTGKSFTYVKLCEEHGNDNIYLLTDYSNGGFDNYCAEPILFMDEFKGGLPFQLLLNYLDKYPVQIHCRYTNSYALWDSVHVSSIYPPEDVFLFMVDKNMQERDMVKQLLRRIDTIVYHYIEDGEFKTFELPMNEYLNYETLKHMVEN